MSNETDVSRTGRHLSRGSEKQWKHWRRMTFCVQIKLNGRCFQISIIIQLHVRTVDEMNDRQQSFQNIDKNNWLWRQLSWKRFGSKAEVLALQIKMLGYVLVLGLLMIKVDDLPIFDLSCRHLKTRHLRVLRQILTSSSGWCYRMLRKVE